MWDSWSRGRGFDSRPLHYQVMTLGKLFTPCASITKQYNLVPAKGRWCSEAGKITIGLASHWPRGTDFSGLSTYGLTATKREMSTPPTLQTNSSLDCSLVHFLLSITKCVSIMHNLLHKYHCAFFVLTFKCGLYVCVCVHNVKWQPGYTEYLLVYNWHLAMHRSNRLSDYRANRLGLELVDH